MSRVLPLCPARLRARRVKLACAAPDSLCCRVLHRGDTAPGLSRRTYAAAHSSACSGGIRHDQAVGDAGRTVGVPARFVLLAAVPHIRPTSAVPASRAEKQIGIEIGLSLQSTHSKPVRVWFKRRSSILLVCYVRMPPFEQTTTVSRSVQCSLRIAVWAHLRAHKLNTLRHTGCPSDTHLISSSSSMTCSRYGFSKRSSRTVAITSLVLFGMVHMKVRAKLLPVLAQLLRILMAFVLPTIAPRSSSPAMTIGCTLQRPEDLRVQQLFLRPAGLPAPKL